ncbi:MAG: hypothetical protein JWM59_1791 [Verrucomicrobiales bacterium]|nr:hypothetical protein [Verrucomicrobiales bacterium]
MPLPLIHLNDLPPGGRNYSGELRTDIFELSGKFDPKFTPPFKFDLAVRVDDGDIIVQGWAETVFEMQCSRCTQQLPWRVRLDPYFTCEERDGAATLDLTAQLREDTLLALPGYPRCEESNVAPRPCSRDGGFAPESEYVPLDGEETVDPGQRDAWGALDNLPSADPKPKS